MVRYILNLAICCLAANAFAHHSYTEFDDKRIVEIVGVLTKAAWQNPHAKLEVESKDAQGKVVRYDIETTPLNFLRRWQVPLEIYEVGSTVKVAGWPSKREAARIYGTNILSADGRETVLWRSQPRWKSTAFGTEPTSSSTAAAAGIPPATSIFQVWGSGYARPGVPDDPDAVPGTLFRTPLPLTKAAQQAAAAYDPVTQAEQGCTPRGMPWIMAVPYPMELLDRGDTIMFHQEENDVVRTFHMNGDSRAAASQPLTPLGYSVGRWDGDTLVVETSRASSKYFTPIGNFSENAQYVERFELAVDGSRLLYTLTISDPAVLTEPVELKRSWIQVPGEKVMAFKCDEAALR